MGILSTGCWVKRSMIVFRNCNPAVLCSKANKEARLMERKICYILNASDWGHGGGQTPVQSATPPLTIMGQQSVQAEEWGYMQKQQSALTVILKLVTSGLTNIIVIVLNTGDFKFQGCIFPISLRPMLTTVGASVMAPVWSS